MSKFDMAIKFKNEMHLHLTGAWMCLNVSNWNYETAKKNAFLFANVK